MEGLVPKFQKFMKHHNSTILTVLGSFGVIGTAVVTAKVTPKAVELIKSDSRKNHDGDPYAYTKKEAIKSAWKCYIPVALVGGTTISCIVGANILNKQAQASLASAYALLDSSYREYKGKLKELYGEEAHNNIVDAIVKEHCEDVYIHTDNLIGTSCLDFITSDPEVTRIFYDSFSKRYFETTINKVLQAEYHLNRNYTIGSSITLNEFYNFLGLSEIDCGDEIGWDFYNSELYWIDFSHHVTKLDDGMEICIIDFEWNPMPFSDEEHY